MEPKFVIASTGRSGTGYISQVLRAAGINCGHEEYFCFPWRDPKGGLDGDSSWLAVKQLDGFGGRVFHQVRDPLHVLSSLCYCYPGGVHERYLPIRYEMIPGGRTDDLQKDFMRMIVWMNKEIENYSVMTYQVEKLNKDVTKLQHITNQIGQRRSNWMLNKALDSVSVMYNQHHKREFLSWDQILESQEKQKLMQQADRYGYDTTD